MAQGSRGGAEVDLDRQAPSEQLREGDPRNKQVGSRQRQQVEEVSGAGGQGILLFFSCVFARGGTGDPYESRATVFRIFFS